MTAIRIGAITLAVIGIVLILGIKADDFGSDILAITASKADIRTKIKEIRSGRSQNTIGSKLRYFKSMLESMGKGSQFSVLCVASVVLFAAGIVVASLIGNPYLVPAFGVGLASIPVVYSKNLSVSYKKHISEELETALSVITTSYLRSDDIIAAIQENIDYIKPPIREHFVTFVNDVTYVTSTEQALMNLRSKIDNDIFKEWCDVLVQCQSDRVIKETLQAIVSKLTDVRIANAEVEAILGSCKMNFYMLAAITVSAIPILYFINKDWFDVLFYTNFGKITLGVVGILIIVCYFIMLKITEPVEYDG